MKLAIKRLRYFKYFFTQASDWLAEQLYHRGRQQRHNKHVHGWGIASGLRIQPTEPASLSVIIPAGLALDPDGEELLLENSQTLDLTSARPSSGTKTLYIALKYSEQNTDPVYVEATGNNEYTRVEEVTSVVILDAPPGSPYVEIGRIVLSSDVTAITAAADPNNPGTNEIDLRYTRTLQGGAEDEFFHNVVEEHHHSGEPGQPEKVDLTNGNEVRGQLPGSMVTGTVPDADTVDGIHASTVPTANRLLALNGQGLFPNSVLEKGMVRQKFDEVTTSFDWNKATSPGFYHGHSTINAPADAASAKIVMVMTHSNNDIAQWMMDMGGNVFYRSCSAGTWSSWRKLWHSENIGAGSGLEADLLDGKHATDFAAVSHSHPSVTDYIPGFMTPYLLQHLRDLSNYLSTFTGLAEEFTPLVTLQNYGDSYTAPQSGSYNSKLYVKVTARVQGNTFAGVYTQYVTIRWKIYYRKNGGSWVLWKTDSYTDGRTSSLFSTRSFASSTTRTYSLNVPSNQDRYELKVVHDNEWSNGQGYFGTTERNGTWVRVDEVKYYHAWPGASF